MKKTDLAWVAGLLEGEGCFSLRSRAIGTAKGNIMVSCHMCDRDVLERLLSFVGFGSLNGPYSNGANPKHKPRYMFRVSGKPAYKLMKSILPFMCSRRAARINQLILMYEQVEPKPYYIKNLRSGKIHRTVNLTKWCATHDMSLGGLSRTLNGNRNQCYGWQLVSI